MIKLLYNPRVNKVFTSPHCIFYSSFVLLVKYRCKLLGWAFFPGGGGASLEVLIIGRDFVLTLKNVCILFWKGCCMFKL